MNRQNLIDASVAFALMAEANGNGKRSAAHREAAAYAAFAGLVGLAIADIGHRTLRSLGLALAGGDRATWLAERDRYEWSEVSSEVKAGVLERLDARWGEVYDPAYDSYEDERDDECEA